MYILLHGGGVLYTEIMFYYAQIFINSTCTFKAYCKMDEKMQIRIILGFSVFMCGLCVLNCLKRNGPDEQDKWGISLVYTWAIRTAVPVG